MTQNRAFQKARQNNYYVWNASLMYEIDFLIELFFLLKYYYIV